jgi:hypothetical protein
MSGTPVEQLNNAFQVFSQLALANKSGDDLQATVSAMFALQSAIAQVSTLVNASNNCVAPQFPWEKRVERELSPSSSVSSAEESMSAMTFAPKKDKRLHFLKVNLGSGSVKSFVCVGVKSDNAWVENSVRAIGGTLASQCRVVTEPKEGDTKSMPTIFYKVTGSEAECAKLVAALEELKAQSKAEYEARKAAKKE